MTEIEVVGRVKLGPAAGLVPSLGANHTLESAIADLVDNSIDALASRVSVRLLTHDARLVRVEVHDDGHGMDATGINRGLTIGFRREYADTDLGHFGMGLKAASFGHAEILTVWSRRHSDSPVGRRITRASYAADFSCELLSEVSASQADARRTAITNAQTGTTIVWDQIRNAFRGGSITDARTWISDTEQRLRAHLGVVFHRYIQSARLKIDVLVDEVDDADEAIAIPILAIDPFAYTVSGHPGYPKQIVAADGDDTKAVLTCHIWPAKTDSTGFRIGGRSGSALQGFYVYRNDRLLQLGGWSETATASRVRQLARVVVDDPSAIGAFMTMNPEKHGLKFEPRFRDAITRAAADDGTTFEDFLRDAEATHMTSRRRGHRRRAAINPGQGFGPALRKAIRTELPMIHGDPLDLRWRPMSEGEFLAVDLSEKTLWLNSRYRLLFAPFGGSLNDAPTIKAMLYLLTHHVFEGQHLGAREKDDIALWNGILGAAVLEESRIRREALEGPR